MLGLSDFYFDENIRIVIDEIDNKVYINDISIMEEFWYPRGVSYCNGHIYITDSYHHCVKVFNTKGEKIAEFGNSILSEPYGILVNSGNIYVCDKDNGYVRCFDKEYNLIYNFNIKMKQPSMITEKNGSFFVTETNGHRVLAFSSKGEFCFAFSRKIKYPLGISTGEKYIYVAGEFEKTISKFTFDGLFCEIIRKGKAYALVKIFYDKIYFYDSQNNIIEEDSFIEEYTREDDIIENYKDMRELGYYFIRRNINKAVKIFEENPDLLSEENENENQKIAELTRNKDIINFMLKYSSQKERFIENRTDKTYCIELVRTIKNVSADKIEKPKAIFWDDGNIWISLFNKKILACISPEDEIQNYFTSDIQIERLVKIGKYIYFIDYFYKRVYKLNIDNEESEIFCKMDSPVDLKIVEGKLWILDSENRIINVYNLSGKLIKKYSVEGIEPSSFVYAGDILYVLDKRTGNIYMYKNDNKKIKELKNNYGLSFPEGIAVDEEQNVYVTDEGKNRLVKIDKNDEFVFHLKGFSMPKDIFYLDGKLFISDYGNDCVKIFKVR